MTKKVRQDPGDSANLTDSEGDETMGEPHTIVEDEAIRLTSYAEMAGRWDHNEAKIDRNKGSDCKDQE